MIHSVRFARTSRFIWKTFVITVVLFQTSVQAADYGKVSELKSARHGDKITRYIKEYGAPCLHVQVIDPDQQWRVLADKTFCSYEGKSFLTDVTYASFSDLKFANDGVHGTLTITPLQLVDDVVLSCVIPVQEDVIGDLACMISR